MKAEIRCFECLKNQASKLIQDLQPIEEILQNVPKDTQGCAFSPPPKIAIAVYEKIAFLLQKQDVFLEQKRECIQYARALITGLSPKNLQEALKLCVLGNVIDYGSQKHFVLSQVDFAKELEQMEFAYFDFEAFKSKLEQAKSFVLIGDNAGENLFDELFLRFLKQLYPTLKLYYFVRGKPIINDITLKDLQNFEECQGIFEIAKVIDSGVRSPGYLPQEAYKEAQEIFNQADLILAKGMGNFECLESLKDSRLFLLFKIKCSVVADFLNQKIGKMVLKHNLK